MLIKTHETPNPNLIDTGYLKLNITNELNLPVNNATINISFTGNPTDNIESISSNSSGITEFISLKAPPVELSLNEANNIQPYAEYSAIINAPGYEPLDVSGIEILSGENAILPVRLTPSAPDYYVSYTDYIKNVASSEIYSTWPESTIVANVLAIMSFTLNRVYTEWYRNKGYDFTITSSTAYDHKWIYGRNIFENISVIVDDIFDQYLSRPNVRQQTRINL